MNCLAGFNYPKEQVGITLDEGAFKNLICAVLHEQYLHGKLFKILNMNFL